MSSKDSEAVVLRIPRAELLELVALNPELLNASGGIKYGGWQKYFLSLMRRDLEKRKIALKQGDKV